MSILRTIAIAVAIIGLTSCATVPQHSFAAPGPDWQTRAGQLLYRKDSTTLIGDVIVRASKNGEFELTFSKGPGVTVLVLRQDDSFAEVKGPLARTGWSGPVDLAPPQLRGWLGLREKLIHAQNRREIRHSIGGETFFLRF